MNIPFLLGDMFKVEVWSGTHKYSTLWLNHQDRPCVGMTLKRHLLSSPLRSDQALFFAFALHL